MTDILKDLSDKYCEELNEVWLACMANFSPADPDFTAFVPFYRKAKEAWADGYTYKVQCEVRDFIREKIIGTPDEEDLIHFPGWVPTAHIGKLLEDAEQTGHEWSKPYLGMLKSHYTTRVMQDYAVDYVQRKGPFYMTDDYSCIHAFAYSGSHEAEMALISLLAPQLNNHGSTSTH